MAWERTKIIDACDKLALASLYVLALVLPVSKATIEVTSTLAIACYLAKKILQRQKPETNALNLAVVSYLAVCFISIFLSTNLKVSARTFWGKTIQEVLFFFTVVETLSNEKRLGNFVGILLISSFAIGIDGIYQHFTHRDFIRHRPYYGLPRIHATFPTPNDFGSYLIAIMPFALGFFIARANSRRLRYVSVSLFALLFACLMLTVSRGAWFAFVGSVIFMSIWSSVMGVFLLGLVIFIIATHPFYGPLVKERLQNFFIFDDVSSIDRRVIWQTAWRMFNYNPFLGLGLGTFMSNFSKFMVGDYTNGLIPYTHNCYLQMATEVGLLGLSCFISVLIFYFFKAVKTLNRSMPLKGLSWYILLAAAAAMLAYCLQMAVDTVIYSLDLGMLFWILLAIGVAAMNNIRPQTQKAAASVL